MSTELTAPTNTDGGNKPPAGKPSTGGTAAQAGRGGFFKLYKPGQGYWTRLGTGLGAAAVIIFIAWFTFDQSRLLIGDGKKNLQFGISVAVAAILALIAWWLMNGAKRAQFLIDTDSEMKKVNWAGWSELIGSTRVVVFFMVLTAVILFTLDTQFHALFYSLRVWHIEFNSLMGQITGALLGVTLLLIGWAVARGMRKARADRNDRSDLGESTGRGRLIVVLATVLGIAVLTAWTIYSLKFDAPVPAATISLNAAR